MAEEKKPIERSKSRRKTRRQTQNVAAVESVDVVDAEKKAEEVKAPVDKGSNGKSKSRTRSRSRRRKAKQNVEDEEGMTVNVDEENKSVEKAEEKSKSRKRSKSRRKKIKKAVIESKFVELTKTEEDDKETLLDTAPEEFQTNEEPIEKRSRSRKRSKSRRRKAKKNFEEEKIIELTRHEEQSTEVEDSAQIESNSEAAEVSEDKPEANDNEDTLSKSTKRSKSRRRKAKASDAEKSVDLEKNKEPSTKSEQKSEELEDATVLKDKPLPSNNQDDRSKSRKKSKSRRRSKRIKKKTIDGDKNSDEVETVNIDKVDDKPNLASEKNVSESDEKTDISETALTEEIQVNIEQVKRRKSRRIKTTDQEKDVIEVQKDESGATDNSRSAKKSRRFKRQEQAEGRQTADLEDASVVPGGVLVMPSQPGEKKFAEKVGRATHFENKPERKLEQINNAYHKLDNQDVAVITKEAGGTCPGCIIL